MTKRGKLKFFLPFFIFQVVVGQTDLTRTFRCFNTDDILTDTEVSTYVVNNGYNDCVSGYDEDVYDSDASVSRHGFVTGSSGARHVYPFALACQSSGTSIDSLFPEKKFACPGDFGEELYQCSELCDGYLRCANGFDEDVCFNNDRAFCAKLDDLPGMSLDYTSGKTIYPRQCENFCKNSFFAASATWFAIIPGNGDDDDACDCYDGAPPTPVGWEECDTPCFYGNGFIPCGSATNSRVHVGMIREGVSPTTQGDCSVNAATCIAPLAQEQLNVTCDSLEEGYQVGGQTKYKVDVEVKETKCFVSKQSRDNVNGLEKVYYALPDDVDNGDIDVRVSTEYGIITYTESFSFCPKRAVSLEVTGFEYQPTGLPSDLSLTLFGGEEMKLTLWTENSQGSSSSPYTIESSLNLVYSLGDCMCDSSDLSVAPGDILAQEGKGEKMVFPYQVTKTGYIYAVSACVKYGDTISLVDAGSDDLKLTKVRPECTTAGFVYCESTRFCHPEDSLCDVTAATEDPSFKRVTDGFKNSEKYDLDRFLENCGCKSIFSQTEGTLLTKVEPGDYLAVEISSIFAEAKYFIEGDLNSQEEIIVVDSAWNYKKRINGKMSLKVYIYEEHEIDLSDLTIVQESGPASIFAQVEYNNACGCGTLISEKQVTMQSIPVFQTVDSATLLGTVTTPDNIVVGPFNSGPVKVLASGDDLRYMFSTSQSDIVVTTLNDDTGSPSNSFEIDCGCSASEGSCQHTVDVLIQNDLPESYEVNQPLTVTCDHCNLPTVTLNLKMKPATGGDSYEVPSFVGRDENVLVFFEKNQNCDAIQKCPAASDAVWYINGVHDTRFVTTELPYTMIEREPNSEIVIRVCQMFCKEGYPNQVEACGSVTFTVSPSSCTLTPPSSTSIVLNEEKTLQITSRDPDDLGLCNTCSMTVHYNPADGTASEVSSDGQVITVDAPSDHGYVKGEKINIDYCCTDNQPNRPQSCGSHTLEVIAPGEPEIELVESEELKSCHIDCDQYSEFEVAVQCDNCQGLSDDDISIRWRMKQEGYECDSTSPDSISIYSLQRLSEWRWTFKTIDVCSIFQSPDTEGLCLCVDFSFSRSLGGQRRTLCRLFERNFGPEISDSLVAKYMQEPEASECLPILSTSNLTFDSELATGLFKPITYNILIDNVPLTENDSASPKFEVFLREGYTSVTIRATDSCKISNYKTINVLCEKEVSNEQVNQMSAGWTITDKESQSKAISQMATAADKCDETCSENAASVLTNVNVGGADSALQVSSIGKAMPLERMNEKSQNNMVKMVGKTFTVLKSLKGDKSKGRSLSESSEVMGRVISSSNKKRSSSTASTTATTTTTTTTTTTAEPEGNSTEESVCGGNSGQSLDLAQTLRESLGDLSSATVCDLSPGDKSQTIKVTEDDPVFEMNCTRSKNQIFQDSNTYIPQLPSDCANDSCALCNIRFLGCADAMPADNAPDSQKIDIKLLKITEDDSDSGCSLNVLKMHDLPLESAIEFSNENLNSSPVDMVTANLTLDKNFLAVDVNVTESNSALIVDFCLDTLMQQATQLVVRGRHNFTSSDWAELDESSMDVSVLSNNASAYGDDFIYVINPGNFSEEIENVTLDGIGVISMSVQSQCLVTNVTVDKCFRAFVSGFTVGDRVGEWSIVIMAQFAEDADSETTVQEIDTVVYSTTCLYYNESLSLYTTEGTSPSPDTSCAVIKCKTTHLSSFGGSFFVPPNSLNVLDSMKMLANLNDNPTVFATLVTVFGLYILVVVWCRRKDRKDEKKLGITFLADNDPNDSYQYEITVYTGIGGDAGTSSNITVVLCGDKTSKPHVLFDDDKDLFSSGSVDTFILTTPQSLGELASLQIWHNNKGNQPSWYLKHVVVKDMGDNNKQYIFLNNRWLAVDKDDGQVEREIPVASDTELKDFTTLFKNKIERDLWDGNIWFSVFGRPVRSNFSRVQRASCCLCLLYCTMLANIMFFGAAAADTNTISVMGIELSWTQVMIGLQCNVVIFPVNFLIVYLFKNAKPRVPKELQQIEALKNGKSLTASRGHHRTTKSQKSFTNLNSASRISIQSTGRMTVSHTSMFKSNRSKPKGFKQKILALFGKKQRNPLDASTCSIESVINEPPPSEMEEGKKPKGLPWWTVIIAWILMALVSLIAAFFTLLYGMSYGKEDSNLWLKTFLMGFFESLFFVQPIKMICLGLFFALLIKKPEQPDPKEQQRMEIIEVTSERGKSIVELDYSDYKKQYKKLQQAYVKPMATDIEAARKYREKMKKMWDALFEIGRYILFLFLLSTICNAQTDPQGYLMTENLRNMFTTGTKWPAITKYPDFWAWMYTSLIPGLYSQQWYNGNTTADIQGFTNDKQSYLVGAARIRQVRMDPLSHCDAPKIVRETVNDCYPDYSLGDGDTGGYLEKWVLPNETINTDEYYVDEKVHPVGSNPWVYVPQLQADGIPIFGDLNVYGPGGYIMTLNTDKDVAVADVERLQENSWVDTLTRAVIVEFTVFNPNVNLFSVVSLVIEFSAQGDGYPYEQMKTLRLYPYMSSAGYLVLVCQLAYLIFLIYYMWVEAKEIKQLKWKYLRQFWNWVELIIISLSWTSFGLIVSYLVGVEVTMNQIKEFSDSRFISFGGPATVNETYRVVSAITCWFGYIKLMYMLRFNKKMSSFANVLKVAAQDITNFLIMFTVVFVAFAQFAYLVLGSVVSGYKSFVTTSTTLMAMLLGQWDFYEVEEADRFLGPGFLFTYIISANLILLNVFLSIICEACDQVNGEVAQQENDFEVVDFMVGQVKMLIGTSRLTQNASKKMEEDDEEDKEEAEKKKKELDIDSIMCDFDSQMNYISGHYCGTSDEEDDDLDKMLDDYSSRSLLFDSGADEHSFSPARSFNTAVQH